VITVGRLMPVNQWDQTMVDDLFANRLGPTGIEFTRVEGWPETTGAIVIIPGHYWVGRANLISEHLSRYDWVLAIRTGDERDDFDPDRVYHRNIRWWVQTPRTDREHPGARLFGVGYSPHLAPKRFPPVKYLEVFLSAQDNHARRTAAFAALTPTEHRVVHRTEGFTLGIPPLRYTEHLRAAKVAPAPSGVFSPDSFRVWEALQAGAVPIADDLSPAYDSRGYWQRLLGEPPFPVYTDPAELPALVDEVLDNWDEVSPRVRAWWKRYKFNLTQWLIEDLLDLGALT